MNETCPPCVPAAKASEILHTMATRLQNGEQVTASCLQEAHIDVCINETPLPVYAIQKLDGVFWITDYPGATPHKTPEGRFAIRVHVENTGKD